MSNNPNTTSDGSKSSAERSFSDTTALDQSEQDRSDAYQGPGLLEHMATSFPAIVFAGAIYPFCFAILAVLIVSFTETLFSEAGTTLIAMVIFSLFGAVVGAMVAAVSGVWSLIVLAMVNATTGYPLKPRTCAIAAGGMAGYLPTSWVFFNEYWDQAAEMSFAVLLGPILAMTVASICVSQYASRRFRTEPDVQTSSKWQFRIRHLMVATGWFALLFGIANVLNGVGFAVLVGIWVVLQAALILIGRGVKRLLSPPAKTSRA